MRSIQARIQRLWKLNSSSLTASPVIILRLTGSIAAKMIFSRIWIPTRETDSSEHLLLRFSNPSPHLRILQLLRSSAEAAYSMSSSSILTIRQCSYVGRWSSWRRSSPLTSHSSEASQDLMTVL